MPGWPRTAPRKPVSRPVPLQRFYQIDKNKSVTQHFYCCLFFFRFFGEIVQRCIMAQIYIPYIDVVDAVVDPWRLHNQPRAGSFYNNRERPARLPVHLLNNICCACPHVEQKRPLTGPLVINPSQLNPSALLSFARNEFDLPKITCLFVFLLIDRGQAKSLAIRP